MQTRTLLFFVLISLLTSCSSKTDYSLLIGSWQAASNDLQMNMEEEITFTENGEYRAVSNFENSFVYEVLGEYSIDSSNKAISIKFTESLKNGELERLDYDSTYSIKINELSSTVLILDSGNGVLTYTKQR